MKPQEYFCEMSKHYEGIDGHYHQLLDLNQ